MNKWTSTMTSKVTLAQILSVRPNLNEIECWAMLAQCAHALQDVLLRINGGRRRVEQINPVMHPDRILATSTGRIQLLDTKTMLDDDEDFIHPLLRAANHLDYSEKELEALGIYSLGKTIGACHCLEPSAALTDLLSRMTSQSEEMSFLHVLECVSHQWKLLVGSTPISRFVAQLSKLTLQMLPKKVEILETSHIEFSRLDDSTSSSSGSASPTLNHRQLPRPPMMSSSPIQNNNNNNNHLKAPPRLPPKGVTRRTVQRNPSRLYRIVKPLAEIAPTPSNKCIGPEFFVMMQDTHPNVLDLATNFSRKDFVSRQVDVVMLNGQRFFVHVNAATITAGEILDNVLRDQDIKEASLFTMALLKQGEFWPLANDTKIAKVAHPGWKEAKPSSSAKILGESVTLYQRLKYFPDDVESAFRDPGNKHQLYLQLRSDVLQAKFHMSPSQYLSLAGMALQAEFGDFSAETHNEVYFDLEHYVPAHVITDPEAVRASLIKLHKAHLGQSQSKTEVKFCKELLRHDNYGFHLFKVFTDKKMQQSSAKLLGIHLQGLFLFEPSKNQAHPHRIVASYFWHKLTRIQYDAGKFHLHVADNGKQASNLVKLKFYTLDQAQSKVMFDLSSACHQHSNQLRLRARVELEYKEPTRAIRSLKRKLMPRRDSSSQHKLYTTNEELTRSNARGAGSMRRSTTLAPSTMPKSGDSSNYLVKRLAHYSSMADALVKAKSSNCNQQQPSTTKECDDDLNVSDKENKTPIDNKNYRYKVYLEPEEDVSKREPRLPLQEGPALAEMSVTPAMGKRPMTNPAARRRSETMTRPPMSAVTSASASLHRSTTGRNPRRVSHGIVTTAKANDNVCRMGTQISLSALHRERLRLTTEIKGYKGPMRMGTSGKKPTLDLDYDTMEFKSILPEPSSKKAASAAVVLHESLDETEAVPYADPANESLSESLMERFDNMETDEAFPERHIVTVCVRKDGEGRLGLKITGTASGIYVEDFDDAVVRMAGNRFKKGDRIVAINGRSLENVSYAKALELMRKPGTDSVSFLVSQIKD